MEQYKIDFINFLLQTGALRVGGNYTLKSKRSSPHFVNIGDFNDGRTIQQLGRAYANLIVDHGFNKENSGVDMDAILYGIPEKGDAIAVATAIALADLGMNLPYFKTRKAAKGYGEASNLTPEEMIKAWVVGRAPKNGQAIVQFDDVFTAGDAKYLAREQLQALGDFLLPLLAIAVDRQEVGYDGRSAIDEYVQKTGTAVVSIVNAGEIYQFLKDNAPVQATSGTITAKDVEKMGHYLRVYGTESARAVVGPIDQKIMSLERSVIPACDVKTLEQFEKLVEATGDIEKIGGYKIGFGLGLRYGLPRVVETARKHTDKPLIYDHQKAATDIPDTGDDFAQLCREAGIDAVILFPQAGPETERAWIYRAFEQGLGVIVGGRMTHPAYAVSEGGFITDEGALNMYRTAARAGVTNFVVPGNKPEVITQIRDVIVAEGVSPVFLAPGFIAQGGKLSDAANAAGQYFHGIVGRGIYGAEDMRAAALEHTREI